MENDTPEYFYKKLSDINLSINSLGDSPTDERLNEIHTDISNNRTAIQTQIDIIVNGKPVKSQQLLDDYKDIYDSFYMTNFSIFLGICLILYYIFQNNSNKTITNVPTNP